MQKNRKKPESELGTERKKPIAEAPKSRVAGRHFAIDKVKQSENVSPPHETCAKLAIPEKSGMMNKKELKS